MAKIPVRVKSLCQIFVRGIEENYFMICTKQQYPSVTPVYVHFGNCWISHQIKN